MDLAAKTIPAVYFLEDRDIERGRVYGTLIDKSKVELLSRELGADSKILSAYKPASFDSFGPEFSVLTRSLGSAVLACLLVTDNLRVPFRTVVTSKRLLNCLNEFTVEDEGRE